MNHFLLTLCVIAASVPMLGETARVIPFREFLDATRVMNHIREGRNLSDRNFEAMRHHVLSLYQGVDVRQSYADGEDLFDCIPVEQQPSVRGLGLSSIAAPPPPAEDASAGKSLCEAGTIPMRRIALEELMRFASLDEYLRKSPVRAVKAGNYDFHKYATFKQTVDNLGGNSSINIWSPYVSTSAGQVLTGSQQWYSGGYGSVLQTVEVGWHNFPNKYGDQRSRLFIYYTADDYNYTGCFNLDCSAFVQVSSAVALGGAFGGYSVAGGTQREFRAQFLLYSGNWWLAIDGVWIGYYPASVFKGGQMTKFAQEIEFGVDIMTDGSTWPAGGSGAWATAGLGYAAYQRNVYYAKTSGEYAWANLTPVRTSEWCINTAGPFSSSTVGWGVYFYAGGPGGKGC